MKRLIIGILLMLNLYLGFASVPGINKSKFIVVGTDEFKEVDYQNLILKYVPEKYYEAFMYYTTLGDDLQTINLRLQVLAVGKHETNWKPLTSKANANGSVDKGYLQLNSVNIESPWFMSKFGPNKNDVYKYDVDDELELYLITSINLYKALYLTYGENATYCYNAGERRYRNRTIPDATYVYKYKVKTELDNLYSELTTLKIEREYLESGRIIRSTKTMLENYNKYLKHQHVHRNDVIDITARTDLFCERKRARALIVEASKFKATKNDNYIFIGFNKIKTTGDLAPVFLDRITGETVIG